MQSGARKVIRYRISQMSWVTLRRTWARWYQSALSCDADTVAASQTYNQVGFLTSFSPSFESCPIGFCRKKKKKKSFMVFLFWVGKILWGMYCIVSGAQLPQAEPTNTKMSKLGSFSLFLSSSQIKGSRVRIWMKDKPLNCRWAHPTHWPSIWTCLTGSRG